MVTRTIRHRRGRASRLSQPLAVCVVLLLSLLVPIGVATPAGAAPPCPCSIWAAAATPNNPSEADTAAVEVGTKFRSDSDGFVTGVRFYKGSGNTGTHVGHLWTTAGANLATATFSGESAGGWQQATFASPVAITANTTYIVSYYAPNGRYAADAGGFATQGVDNPPLHALANGVDGANGVYRYGTGGGFPANTYQSSNYWVDVVFDTAATDTTPPTVTANSPATNATGVPTTTTVTATLSEPIQAGTVQVTLTAGATTVPGIVAYDAPSRKVTFTPTAALAVSTVHTATISGAKDPAGNVMADFSWSFTTAASGSGCPCTVWANTAVPAVVTVNDSSAVELGVRFRTSTTGYITGLRFYKGPSNTGAHTGSLWTNTGTRLSTVTYSGETGSGWQTATLPSPVPVTANTTYVASYHTDAGFYSANSPGGFASSVSRGPLTALANGVDGANGVYLYGGGGFPSNTYQSSNYWVDVVFDTSATDTVAPTVIARAPAPNATGISTATKVNATFSEPVTAVAMTMTGPAGNVAGTVAYDAPTATSTFTPAAALATSASYTVTVNGAKDAANNVMAPISWSFTTAAPPPPPPDQGPGGPVLVIKNSAPTASQFTPFTAEILRTEGLNEFATADLSTVTATMLNQYDVVLLGSTPLTAAQVSMFTSWVTAGGNLITFRPDKQLAALLGLTSTTTTLAQGYVKVDTTTAPGVGITDQTIQYHGTADRYTLNGATAVATLYSNATTATTNPAVSLVNVGTSGGQAAAFTYDLAQSTVYLRQGNPAWDQQERDGQIPIRSDDLYFGGASTDWVNLTKAAIPQADEQQRLLANLIGAMNLDKKPLPRFWYFPRSAKAVVVATGDDHGNGGTAGRFDQYTANSPAGCVVDNWDCLRFTSYVYTSTPLSDAQASAYNTNGFEVGDHVSSNCANWTPASLADNYTTQLSQWAQKYTSLPVPVTNRLHCIVWSDWSTQPTTEAQNGIRLDTNYYYWPGSWLADRPGFMTGSGMPMRFSAKTGGLIDVYQAATQMTDESGQSYPFTPNTLLDDATGPLGYYGAFTANEHTDSATTFQSDQLLASAVAHGVPMVTARQMLTWLDGRNGSSYSATSWAGNTLSFTVNVGAGANGLTGMVPTQGPGGTTLTGLTLAGSPVSFTKTTIKGVEYAMFLAGPGGYAATYGAPPAAPAALGGANVQPLTAASATQDLASIAPLAATAPDQTAPVISPVAARPLPDGTAQVTWSTDENADATLQIGPQPNSLAEVYDDTRDTTHTVVATKLQPGATYYYRVKSVDPAGNATVWPTPTDPPATFVAAANGVADLTAQQFRSVSSQSGTYVQQDNLGEVSLAPAAAAEFDTAALPSTWDQQQESTGGGTVLRRGNLVLDGARAGTKAQFGPGRSLVFRATFAGPGTQWAGLAAGTATDPWAMFGLRNGTLYAALNTTNGLQTIPLPARLIGTAHRYRIDWSSTGFTFSVDGNKVGSLQAAIPLMRLRARDTAAEGSPLTVDWVRLSGYGGSGSQVSRVLDAHQMVTWDRLTYTADIPAGATLRVSVRTGSTAKPDSTWSAWTPVASGGRVVGDSRYLQYRVDMSTTVPSNTPVLRDIGITNNGTPLNPPTETSN